MPIVKRGGKLLTAEGNLSTNEDCCCAVCPEVNLCRPPSVTFSGIVFDCGCRSPTIGAFGVNISAPETYNDVPQLCHPYYTCTAETIVSTRGIIFSDPTPKVRRRTYTNNDCNDLLFDEDHTENVIVGCFDGIWYVCAYGDGIYFYGTTNDLDVPAVNEVICNTEQVEWDNPLMNCVQGGPTMFMGRAHGGTAMITLGCPQYNVDVTLTVAADNTFCESCTGTFIDISRSSTPDSATISDEDCFQGETWSGLNVSCCQDGGNIYYLDYFISCFGDQWIIGGNFVSDPFAPCCGVSFLTFEPLEFVDDPAGSHVFTLDAFGDTIHFTLTLNISPA